MTTLIIANIFLALLIMKLQHEHIQDLKDHNEQLRKSEQEYFNKLLKIASKS